MYSVLERDAMDMFCHYFLCCSGYVVVNDDVLDTFPLEHEYPFVGECS